MAKKARSKRSPHVPDQIRGFTAQATRMACLLLTSPDGSVVSLEKLDDVAVENEDDTVLAVQTKDSEAGGNPICNRSLQLWKTFANWVRQVNLQNLDPSRTHFEIYLNKKRPGPLVEQFDRANTKQLARDAIVRARDLLWGTSPGFTKKAQVAHTLKPHLEEIFSQKGEAALRQIVERFHLAFATESPELDLLQALKRSLRLEEEDIVLEVLVDVHGWLKKLIDEDLRQRRPPSVEVQVFINLLRGSYQRIRPTGVLPDMGDRPTPTQIASMLDNRFVKQMEIISLDESSRNRAINFFLRSRSARTKWAARGDALVHEDDIIDFEENLRHFWRSCKERLFSDPGRTDEQLRGRLLLADCESCSLTVEGKTVPVYFIPGCFHELANRHSDLGWHPRFETLLI